MSRHRRYPVRLARTAFGIRAQDLRTLARTAWWARRWIAALEAMRLGPRFGRGRQYAVSGQVTELVLEGPRAEAVVVGSRTTPYHVSLEFTSVTTPAVADALKRNPMTVARLLTDDLPLEVEGLFRDAGVPLFPCAAPVGKTSEGRPVYDVKMHCTCPDWARPCKHLVATLLLLGEEIARRPATLLALRGVDLDDLVPASDVHVEADACASIPAPDALGGEARPDALLQRLGAVPFWRGGTRCTEGLGRIYGRVHAVALDAAHGKSIDLRRP